MAFTSYIVNWGTHDRPILIGPFETTDHAFRYAREVLQPNTFTVVEPSKPDVGVERNLAEQSLQCYIAEMQRRWKAP